MKTKLIFIFTMLSIGFSMLGHAGWGGASPTLKYNSLTPNTERVYCNYGEKVARMQWQTVDRIIVPHLLSAVARAKVKNISQNSKKTITVLVVSSNDKLKREHSWLPIAVSKRTIRYNKSKTYEEFRHIDGGEIFTSQQDETIGLTAQCLVEK